MTTIKDIIGFLKLCLLYDLVVSKSNIKKIIKILEERYENCNPKEK
jgi:hypothetical protein